MMKELDFAKVSYSAEPVGSAAISVTTLSWQPERRSACVAMQFDGLHMVARRDRRTANANSQKQSREPPVE